jgi:hypothetical protein
MTDKFELIDEDTGEVHQIQLTSMVGDLRDFFISRRRNELSNVPWNKLSEDKQKDEITAANEQARQVVYKLAEAIAEGGRQCAHVGVQKFGVDVDKGELTITCKGYADDEVLLDLVHAKGKVVKLTVLDPGQFNQRSNPLQADPDQPSFFGEDKAAAPEPSSDEDIEDMGGAMDADLDAMEEPDDLHEEEVAEEQKPNPEKDGYEARMRGDGPDDNPYDGGTDYAIAWASGYDRAIEDIATVTEAGQKAARDGVARSDSGFKQGSDGERFWLHGYDKEQNQIENDSFEQGRLAAELGHDIDVNPHPKKTTKHRLWEEGHASHKNPE